MKKMIMVAAIAATIMSNVNGALSSIKTVWGLIPEYHHNSGECTHFVGTPDETTYSYDYEYYTIEIFGKEISYNYKDNLE